MPRLYSLPKKAEAVRHEIVRPLGRLLALATGCLCALPAGAAVYTGSAPVTNAVVPGADLAHAISEITGVAISPLLGASAVGIWRYFHAQTPEQRARLPWFAQPWFWIPALVLVTACFLKDTLGLAAPRLLKKPLDVADAIGHKISGLIAIGAFVPLVAAVFQPADAGAALQGNSGFLAAIDLSWVGNGIMVPVSMLAFFIVFLASNAINVLILLSPFAVIDAALKGFRLLVLLHGWGDGIGESLAGSSVGADYPCRRLLHCRLVVPAVVLRADVHLGYCDAATAAVSSLTRPPTGCCSPARSTACPPAPTARLRRDEQGRLVLQYRPWLVLRKRTLTLPEGQYAIGMGLFYSQLLNVDGRKLSAVILLPPRYRGHEEKLVSIYGLTGVREAGLRAAFRWLQETLGLSERLPAPAKA